MRPQYLAVGRRGVHDAPATLQNNSELIAYTFGVDRYDIVHEAGLRLASARLVSPSGGGRGADAALLAEPSGVPPQAEHNAHLPTCYARASTRYSTTARGSKVGSWRTDPG